MAVGDFSEREREVRDESLGLEGVIQGFIPVQAEGKVKGWPYYFRARSGYWEFTVSMDRAVDPSCLNAGKTERGFFMDDEYRGFIASGEYGKEARYMAYDLVEAAIRDSALEFLKCLDVLGTGG